MIMRSTVLASLVLLLPLGGQPARAAEPASTSIRKPDAAEPQRRAEPAQVHRRSPGKPGAPVRVAFDRNEGFDPGEPAAIAVTLASAAALEALQATFRPSAGLTLLSGARFSHDGAAAAGSSLAHSIEVSAPVAGRYSVTVQVVADLGGRRAARVFSLPITIGEPGAVAKVRPHVSSAKADSSGARIKSLRAVERPR